MIRIEKNTEIYLNEETGEISLVYVKRSDFVIFEEYTETEKETSCSEFSPVHIGKKYKKIGNFLDNDQSRRPEEEIVYTGWLIP